MATKKTASQKPESKKPANKKASAASPDDGKILEGKSLDSPDYGLDPSAVAMALLVFVPVEGGFNVVKNRVGKDGFCTETDLDDLKQAALVWVESAQEESKTEGKPGAHIIVGDPNDPIAHAAVEIAGTIDDDDDSRRYYVAAARFLNRELMLELAKAWPEIRDVARKTGKDGENAATANVSIALKLDLTNLDILTLDFAFAVAPFKHKYTASTSEDLRQLSLDFVAGTVTQKAEVGGDTQEDDDEGAGEDSGAGAGASGEGSEQPGSTGRAAELEAMDRDALVALATDKQIEVPSRARKSVIIELILAKEAQPAA